MILYKDNTDNFLLIMTRTFSPKFSALKKKLIDISVYSVRKMTIVTIY